MLTGGAGGGRHGTSLQNTQPGLKGLTEKLNLLETSQLTLPGGAWLFHHKRSPLLARAPVQTL